MGCDPLCLQQLLFNSPGSKLLLLFSYLLGFFFICFIRVLNILHVTELFSSFQLLMPFLLQNRLMGIYVLSHFSLFSILFLLHLVPRGRYFRKWGFLWRSWWKVNINLNPNSLSCLLNLQNPLGFFSRFFFSFQLYKLSIRRSLCLNEFLFGW